MKCSRAEELFTDYLDGTLSSPLRTDLEEHLEGCTGCASLYTAFEEIVHHVLPAVPRVQPEAGLERRVLSAMRRRRRFEAREVLALPRRATWAAWVAAAAFFVMLVLRPPEGLASWSIRLNQLARQTYSSALGLYRDAERIVDELDVLRATVSIAFENRIERLAERIRELEEARKKREQSQDQSDLLFMPPRGEQSPHGRQISQTRSSS